MPIYEYRCKKGHTFDVKQGFDDGPVTVCEVCSAPVQRVFHPIAVHFKGSGFYNTDYGTRKRSREMKEGKEGVGKSESSKDSKSDSKAGSSSDSSSGSSDSSSSGSGSSGSGSSGSSSSGSSSSGSSSDSASKSGAKRSESKA